MDRSHTGMGAKPTTVASEEPHPTTVKSHRAALRRSSQRLQESRVLWLFMIPAALFYGFVVVWPSVQGAAFAFTDWDGLDPVKNFVGLDQFVKLWNDPNAVGALGHTLLIAFTITIVQTLVGLLLALGVNSRIKSRNVLRVLFFAPVIITPVATGYLWRNLLSPDGAVNQLLETVGLGAFTQAWLGNADYAIWCICLVVVWQFSGYTMVIFLANLQGISSDILEAAEVDGAGPFRKFWSIIRPELAPAFTITLMLSIIGGLKLFDQVWVMTMGGPGYATDTLSTLLYKSAFQYGDFAYGIAIALTLTVLMVFVSGAQYKALSSQNRGD